MSLGITLTDKSIFFGCTPWSWWCITFSTWLIQIGPCTLQCVDMNEWNSLMILWMESFFADLLKFIQEVTQIFFLYRYRLKFTNRCSIHSYLKENDKRVVCSSFGSSGCFDGCSREWTASWFNRNGGKETRR